MSKRKRKSPQEWRQEVVNGLMINGKSKRTPKPTRGRFASSANGSATALAAPPRMISNDLHCTDSTSVTSQAPPCGFCVSD